LNVDPASDVRAGLLTARRRNTGKYFIECFIDTRRLPDRIGGNERSPGPPIQPR